MIFPEGLPAHIRYIFFDLDLTLLRVHSGLVLLRRAVELRLVSRLAYRRLQILGLIYRMGCFPAGRLMRTVLKLLTGLPVEKFTEFTENALPEIFDKIRPEVWGWLKFCRERGLQTGILSAAVSDVCEPVRSFLNLNHTLSTRLEVTNNRLTGKSKEPVCYGSEKWSCLQNWLRNQGADPGQVCYVADAWSDRFVMEKTGYAVCLNPGGRLRRLAGQKSWVILNLPESSDLSQNPGSGVE